MRGHPGLGSPETALARDDGCGVCDGREDSSTEDLPRSPPATAARILFSDIFAVEPATLANYGAFDISLVNDLPLFIDPFLLFHSQKPEYRHLHGQIIDYLRFLRDRSATRTTNDADLRLWYCFPEISQNWLGFCLSGNRGSGLGLRFARKLHENLNAIFSDFGREQITSGSHLEKVCLVREGIGRDNISDFATNFILGYLCQYTQGFAMAHLGAAQVRAISIDRAAFNYSTEMWERRIFQLPFFNGDHVILTPRDILTRDETWINRHDLIDRFNEIPVAIPDAALRAAIMNYFWKELTRGRSIGKLATSEERAQAVATTVRTFPELVDYYIRLKEDHGGDAISRSADKVTTTEIIFSKRLREILLPILEQTEFFKQCPSTYTETWARLAYLKHVIEDRGGWRVFYHKGRPIERELDLQILFRLVWFGTTADASSEANDGRGPVDFKISRGREKTLVEFKLASNRKLEINLKHQTAIYQRSSDAQTAIYAIIYFTEDQLTRVHAILKRLGRTGDKDILLIDARSDNKQSASIAAQL